MLLPTIIFEYDNSLKVDIDHRYAREWLGRLERQVSPRRLLDIGEDDNPMVDQDGLIDFDLINNNLTACHEQVLWKSPEGYLRILDSFEEAMDTVAAHMDEMERDYKGAQETNPRLIHAKLAATIKFHRQKLHSIESFRTTTLLRLEIQRYAVS